MADEIKMATLEQLYKRVLHVAPKHIAIGEVRSPEEVKILVDAMRYAPRRLLP